jgi:hypothetical protein
VAHLRLGSRDDTGISQLHLDEVLLLADRFDAWGDVLPPFESLVAAELRELRLALYLLSLAKPQEQPY